VIALASYLPFITPMSVFHDWWYVLIVPLSFGISMIYKALRIGDLDRYWREVAIMALQIILGMIALAIALMLLVQVVIPALPVE